MIRCTFHLNGYGLSTLSCPGIGFFPAYSGNEGPNRNNPDSIATPDIGPLPPGRYYIVDRPQGLMSPIYDYFSSHASGSDRELWFGLYRDDGNIDDSTFVEKVKRGNFRLHPAGYQGISKGCITLPSKNHYTILRNALLSTASVMISASLRAYGTVQVY